MEKCSLVSFPVVSFVDFLVFFSLLKLSSHVLRLSSRIGDCLLTPRNRIA